MNQYIIYISGMVWRTTQLSLAVSASVFLITTTTSTLHAAPKTLGVKVRGGELRVQSPDHWSLLPSVGDDETRTLINAPAAGAGESARLNVSSESYADHAAAVQRLKEIAAEYDDPVTVRSIAGWPAVQR